MNKQRDRYICEITRAQKQQDYTRDLLEERSATVSTATDGS
jgi:hypothetical protein